MRHVEQLEKVRELVSGEFQTLGAISADGIQETILIRDGQYCGRRFRSELLHAIWFIEENEIKFYSAEGGVLRVCSPDERPAADVPQHQQVA